VFGGMIIATFVATVFVPLFFVFVERRKKEPASHATVPAPEQPCSMSCDPMAPMATRAHASSRRDASN
jgi:hypothetical protein